MLLVVAIGGRTVLHRVSAGELEERRRGADAAAVHSERRVAATAEYAGAALTSTRVPAAVRRDLRDLVRAEARAGVEPVQAALDRLERVRVPPWEGDLRRVRDACARHLRALLQHLQGLATDLRSLYARPAALAEEGCR